MRFAVAASLALICTAGRLSGARIELQFDAETKWFGESYSREMRDAARAFFAGLSSVIASDEAFVIRLRERGPGAYASAVGLPSLIDSHNGVEDKVWAPQMWLKSNGRGDLVSFDQDGIVSWNFDYETLYDGDIDRMVRNVAGLFRHEVHHSLGMASDLAYPRGTPMTAPGTAYPRTTLYDTILVDANGDRMIRYDPASGEFVVNDFALAKDWDRGQNQSGLAFPGVAPDGSDHSLPLSSFLGWVDFHHIAIISYSNFHPTWETYEDVDFAFLRGMGYQLLVDRPELAPQHAALEIADRDDGLVTLRVQTPNPGRFQVAKSTGLRDWDPASHEFELYSHEAWIDVELDPAEEAALYFVLQETGAGAGEP